LPTERLAKRSRLGIRPELIEPASPHQNGRHERMHKDLKAEGTGPRGTHPRRPAGRLAAVQDIRRGLAVAGPRHSLANRG